ncbi:MAG: hypothetical protein J5614_06775 [Paludibacteraceae bacterium]|nr:hypothetical protein [Paludibacteraceae bacterium]
MRKKITDKVYERMLDEANQIQLALNMVIDFADRPKDDSHSRKFIVGVYRSAPIQDKIKPRTYGIRIIYVFDGVPYNITKLKMAPLTIDTVDKYLDIVSAFAFDISDGYSGVPIAEFDKDFINLVKIGKIKKSADPNLIKGAKKI